MGWSIGIGIGVRGLGGVDHEQVGVTFVEGVLNVEEDVVERRMIDGIGGGLDGLVAEIDAEWVDGSQAEVGGHGDEIDPSDPTMRVEDAMMRLELTE